MSSPEVDIDVNVVSSPEPSPHGPVGSESPNGQHTDDEQISSLDSSLFHNSHLNHQSLVSHLPHNVTNQHSYHSIASGLSNNNTSYSHSPESQLSPPKTPPPSDSHQQSTGVKTSTSGYTSFSISSILNRHEPTSKRHIGVITPIPSLPLTAAAAAAAAVVSSNGNLALNGTTSPQDTAMLTSLESRFNYDNIDNLMQMANASLRNCQL
ncbi:uncharacterized protein LOC129717686 [Wyeomyia smithii]|uniref:uncharacterized protein LOC129717686 n=1 Tax=Wyeomyia smithii TaxID=174621 RepID=UPI002467FB93|nr:uncharacterized protein LOC129717686 [Wyeomyia smithii]